MAVVQPENSYRVAVTAYTGAHRYRGPWKPTNRDRISINTSDLIANGAHRQAPMTISNGLTAEDPNPSYLRVRLADTSTNNFSQWGRTFTYLQQFLGYPIYMEFGSASNSLFFYIEEISTDDRTQGHIVLDCSFGGNPLSFTAVRRWMGQFGNGTMTAGYAVTNPGGTDTDGQTQVRLPVNMGTTSHIIDFAGDRTPNIRRGTVQVISRDFYPRLQDEFGATLEEANEALVVRSDEASDFISLNDATLDTLVGATMSFGVDTPTVVSYDIRRASFEGSNSVLFELERRLL